MSDVIRDNVDAVARIGNESWVISEAKVEISRKTVPNYVKMPKIIPENPNYFTDVQELRGQDFELRVNNELIPTRDTQAEKEQVLFDGSLANITTRGTGAYDAVAYDPSQSAVNNLKSGRNLLNRKLEITSATKDLQGEIISLGSIRGSPAAQGTVYDDGYVTVKASEAIKQVLNKLGINDSKDEREIRLKDTGQVVSGPTGEVVGATDEFVKIEESEVTAEKVLNKVSKATNSTWWFDKKGKFYFGLPEPTVHKPTFITDTTAGLTTPPYQSIKIIGSNVAGKKGLSNSVQNAENQVIYGANLNLTEEDEIQLTDVIPPTNNNNLSLVTIDEDFNDPTFIYESSEIITGKQAKNVAKKFGKDIAKQYAKGKVTTVGYPEISLFDVILIPHSKETKKDKGNYRPEQPMGGGKYAVNKIIHKLNGTDGFITEIHVGGMAGSATVALTEDEKAKVPDGISFDPNQSIETAQELVTSTVDTLEQFEQQPGGDSTDEEVLNNFTTQQAKDVLNRVEGLNPLAAERAKTQLASAVREGKISEITAEDIKRTYAEKVDEVEEEQQ